MSAQLETMLLEEVALQQELEHLRTAEDIRSAADKIYQHIESKPDIFTIPPAPDNEWWAQSKQQTGGCCELM